MSEMVVVSKFLLLLLLLLDFVHHVSSYKNLVNNGIRTTYPTGASMFNSATE